MNFEQNETQKLIQQTFKRFESVCPKENIYIVTNERYKDLVKSQLLSITDEQILCEPSRRNTAPCIAYAANKIAYCCCNSFSAVDKKLDGRQ